VAARGHAAQREKHTRTLVAAPFASAAAEATPRTSALLCRSMHKEAEMLKRLRVEPYSTWLERYAIGRTGSITPVVIANGFVFLSGLPPFDPETGDVRPAPFDIQANRVLTQMQRCLEAAGSSMERLVKCNVYCVLEPSYFAAFNAVYARYFPNESPARIFMHIAGWPGPFDIEVDGVAAL
jgi:2-iminobutanoate/2-iminopropanoate deaminase